MAMWMSAPTSKVPSEPTDGYSSEQFNPRESPAPKMFAPNLGKDLCYTLLKEELNAKGPGLRGIAGSYK